MTTARQIIAELVALKDLKDRLELGPGMPAPSAKEWLRHGAEWDEYRRRKPLAWAAARAFLAVTEAEPFPPMYRNHAAQAFIPPQCLVCGLYPQQTCSRQPCARNGRLL